MDHYELESLYKKAPVKNLLTLFKKSVTYEEESERLSSKVRSIERGLIREMQRRIGSVEDKPKNLAVEQIRTMSKQWSLCAASSVKVKRAIQICTMDFMDKGRVETSKVMYVNPSYGIKEHKLYSRFNPFHAYNIEHLETEDLMKMEGDVLFIKDSYGEGKLDLGCMRNIPQLDYSKVEDLIEITQDIVNLYNSWIHFYSDTTANRSEMMDELRHIKGMSYVGNKEEFEKLLLKLDKLVAFKKTLAEETIAQAEKWEPIILKWKETNKNYLVLSELSNSTLKI